MSDSFRNLVSVLVNKFEAYPVDASLFLGPIVENDSQLPTDPSTVLAISNPKVLDEISNTNATKAHLERCELFEQYGLDEYQIVMEATGKDLILGLLMLECRQGLRICVLLCEDHGELTGYRVYGRSDRLENLLLEALPRPN